MVIQSGLLEISTFLLGLIEGVIWRTFPLFYKVSFHSLVFIGRKQDVNNPRSQEPNYSPFTHMYSVTHHPRDAGILNKFPSGKC